MRKEMQIKGDIISNDMKWVYDWFEYDSTCPKDVDAVIKSMVPGDKLVVSINSPGGDVSAGMEIYSILHQIQDVTIEIQGIAGSAAGVISQAGRVRMSPVAMIMIHNVSLYGASGDYHDMDRASEMLRNMNASLANAYAVKSGRDLKEIMKLMDKETWLTAEQALSYGFADEIIQEKISLVNSYTGLRVTPDMVAKAKEEKKAWEKREQEKQTLLDSLEFYGI